MTPAVVLSPLTTLRETHPVRLRTAMTCIVWLLVFVSVVSWRKGVLYSGGADPVVVAKAILAVAAATGAAFLWRTAPARRSVSAYPALLVAIIVVIALVGSVLAGQVGPNLVLSVRIALLGATVLLLLAAAPSKATVTMMLSAMASIGVFAAVTGVPGLAARGRLGGGVPQLEPNELATLVLPAAIALTAVILRRGLRPAPTVALAVLAVIIIASGSRTALLMLVVGAAVNFAVVRRMSRATAAVLLVGAAAATLAIVFGGLAEKFLLRNEGVARLLTLNSRTIAWDAVFATPPTSWSWWLGSGLSVKSIAVTAQYWNTQVFDSSWISSIAQDGMIGTAVLAIYAIGSLVTVSRDRSLRPFALAIVAVVLLRSVVENGLIESSATFVVLFTLASATWPGTHLQLRPVSPDAAGVKADLRAMLRFSERLTPAETRI